MRLRGRSFCTARRCSAVCSVSNVLEYCKKAVGSGGNGKEARRALFQTDMVGDIGEGAFALLLEPGIRHCGFLCRESEATVMGVA